MDNNQPTLFISYCWKDGNTYADELETQLEGTFKVIRDKSQLIANDDLLDFMSEIANCDNVVIVLTQEYVKSLNCMLEMSFLVSQDDWAMKAMVLVIDDSVYSLDRKIEIINYWMQRQKWTVNELNSVDAGKSLYEQENKDVNSICEEIEEFFKGISRRKNPSQIAIVNEIINKNTQNMECKQEIVKKSEDKIMKALKQGGIMNMNELSEKTSLSKATTQRYIFKLLNEKKIKQVSGEKVRCFALGDD